MKVSVIVLTYNSEATVRQALDSVLAQRCSFDYEIIAGDDASSDATPDILREYAAKYPNIRLLLAQKNQGLQGNYYDCLEASSGEYIADCAGDDRWLGDSRLQRMADILDNNIGLGMVYTDWLRHDVLTGHDEVCHPTLTGVFSRRQLQEALLEATSSPAINLSATLYRKQTVMPAYGRMRNTLFRNRDYACEDLQLLMTLAAEADAEYLPMVSLCYNVGGGQTITSEADAAKSVHFTLSALKLRSELAKKYGLDTSRIRRAEADAVAFALGMALRSRDKALLEEVSRQAENMRYIRPTTRLRLLFSKFFDFF